MYSQNGLYPVCPTILVVDDDPDTCKYIAVVLAMHGFKVLQANDSLEAIVTAAAQDSMPDLLLTEMNMPRISGAALAECLKRISSSELKVMYTTRDSDPELMRTGLPVLIKPFDPADLIAAAAQALKTELPSLAPAS